MKQQRNTHNQNGKELSIGQAVDLLSREFPDVTVSSLRFLEREGLLSPKRKPGGHRVYTPHDLYRARKIKQWQAERKSLKEIGELLERVAVLPDLDVVVEEVTAQLLDGNMQPALDRLYELIDAGIPLMNICNDVLTPVLLNLGDDEGNHLIPVDMQFELDEELVRFLAAAMVTPEDAVGEPVVLVCSPFWERHDMPVRMHAALLEERGASVHFLGSMVDRMFVLDAIARVEPDVILVSMTITPEKKVFKKWIEPIIDAISGEQKLMIGGLSSHMARPFESDNVLVLGTATYPEAIEQVLALRD